MPLQYINKVGAVHRITDRGDVRVQYEGCANRWTFHAEALTKVTLITHFIMIIHKENDPGFIFCNVKLQLDKDLLES